MDRNTVIGFALIFIILMVWQWMATPSPEQLAEQKRLQDSLSRVEQFNDSLEQIKKSNESIVKTDTSTAVVDTLAAVRLGGTYGLFAMSATGTESFHHLENDLMKVTFSNKGGRVVDVVLKDYWKIQEDSNGKDVKLPLRLLEDAKNQFDLVIPVKAAAEGRVKSSDLFFAPTVNQNSITFQAKMPEGKSFEIIYALPNGDYTMDFEIRMKGLDAEISQKSMQLNWVNFLDPIEKNKAYERNYSTVYYKPADESPDHCSCTGTDQDEVQAGVKWVSHTQQFFNSTLIAGTSFSRGNFLTEVLDEERPDIKRLATDLTIPMDENRFAMKFYVGPNEFDRLQALGHDLEDIIPFGWSFFGTINRWVIRPLFSFLSQFIGSQGIVILLLTLIVKALLYPLTYKMIYSQSKMSVLKPEIGKLKEKFKDDQQQQQMETMKMYREFGVNPLGGCLPVLLQMPIWFALYRFFPAAIEFRQKGFLWATDLSSYDVFARLPFEIPFYGAHISMFTLIWVVTTIAYTWYNSQFVDFSANPMMKYMQYLMPVFFIFFFNSFASGLTAYLCFSNILNIGQTFATKKWVINEDKIRKDLEDYRKKPKKKGGFQERLEMAMKEQQRVQQERNKKK